MVCIDQPTLSGIQLAQDAGYATGTRNNARTLNPWSVERCRLAGMPAQRPDVVAYRLAFDECWQLAQRQNRRAE